MNTEDFMPVECAIARAGDQVMLCLESREGRLPISSVFRTGNGDSFAWKCADETIEELFLTGESASGDAKELVAQINGEGLLAVEFSPSHEPRHFLMRWM